MGRNKRILWAPTAEPTMSTNPGVKAKAQQLIESLPESAGWDDVMYAVYVRQAIDAGLADADAGRLISHEDLVAALHARLRRAS